MKSSAIIPQLFMADLSFYLTKSISDTAISAIGAGNTGKFSISNLIVFLARVMFTLCEIFLRVLTELKRPKSLGFLSSLCIIIEFSTIFLFCHQHAINSYKYDIKFRWFVVDIGFR